MSKLLIIDGNAIMHRAFHAMPPLTTKDGEPINAVHGMASMLIKVITDINPNLIAVAFDEKEKTFRQKELPSYQAQRPPLPEELSSQFEKARQFLKAANISVFSKPGYEADDVIGTLAVNFSGEVVILTGDRDILQMVDDKRNIKLYMPIAGLSSAKMFGEKETFERMGVTPKQIPDYKGLVGDPSDNYQGVPGIGPKTAGGLLEKYGTFEEVYKHIEDITGSAKDKLVKGKGSGELSYKLATIVKDVPFEYDFEEMGRWDIASVAVVKLFENFGFKTLTERIKKAGKELDEKKQGSLF